MSWSLYPGLFSALDSKNLLPWFVWGLLYAGCTEGIQYLIPYRSFNVSDMLANIIGVVVGFVVFIPLKFLYL